MKTLSFEFGRSVLELATQLAQRMRRVTASAIMELLKTTAKGDYISFASGLPDPALFPKEEIAEATARVLATDSKTALQYGAAEGYAPLREWVAQRMRQRGLDFATPEHILITNGSQQALDLTARLFLEAGAPVALENPSYLAAIQTFDSYEARYLPIPIDADGMQTKHAITTLEAEPPRLVFALPNFQNPSGVSMSLERRRSLAEYCASHAIPLLEDDAYHDLRYEGEALPPIAALAPNPFAVYTGTFSKVIAPGLRVGYLCAPPELTTRLTQLKQITDLHTGSLTQRIVSRFCELGALDPHIQRQNAIYAARRNALQEALATHFGDIAHWTQPQGGMFVLVTLPKEINAANLLAKALERGVVYIPAASFYPLGGGANQLRLNFVSATEDAIRLGVATLSEVIRAALPA